MTTRPRPSQPRQYLIDLQKWRSAVALAACSVTLLCSVCALGACLVNYTRQGWDIPLLFRYFTTLSNMLVALAAGFLIPYAITGIRRKRFACPRWLSILHYTGTICTTLTMLAALFLMLPIQPDSAVGGSNLYLHFVSPPAVLVSFLLVESGYLYTRRDNLLCLLPFLAYSLVYLVMVVFLGEERGGWEDLYRLESFAPAYIDLPLIWLLGLALAFGIRTLSNQLTRMRQNRLLGVWRSDLKPVELKIELYGLGRFHGLRDELNDLSIPYDILDALAGKHGVPTDELLNAFIKGLTDGVRERTTHTND